MGIRNFNEVVNYLPEGINCLLSELDDDLKRNTYEIRLRAEKPLILYGKYGIVCIKCDGTYSSVDMSGAYRVSDNEIQKTVTAVCNYSVYSHQSDIAGGFVTFGNGNRAGFSGKAVVEKGNVVMLGDIESLNIRIAADEIDLPDEIRNCLFDFSGLIIAGPPCSGKTTVLRCIAKTLSSEYAFGYQKVVVIDERFELKCSYCINCDFLSGFPKAYGIEHALRTLSPQVIICDEITTTEQIEKISEGLYSGIRFIASMHCSSVSELMKRPVSRKLLDLNFFDKVILLENSLGAGKIKRIINTKELTDDKYHYGVCHNSFGTDSITDYQKRKYSLQDSSG